MKTITPIIFLISLLAACSPETTDPTQVEAREFALKDGAILPDNPANSYDFIGQLYTQLLDSYYSQSSGASSLEQAIIQGESVASLSPAFQSLAASEGHTPMTVSQMQPYLQTGAEVTDLLSDAYGVKSRNIFTQITQDLASLKLAGATYQQAYNTLVLIESDVASDSGIPNAEREGILTTITILRNAMYHDTRRKRRDRDWEWMIGNIAATANAALESKADALMASFATDVYQL